MLGTLLMLLAVSLIEWLLRDTIAVLVHVAPASVSPLTDRAVFTVTGTGAGTIPDGPKIST